MRGDFFAAGVVIVVGAVLVVLAFTVWDDGGRNYSEDDIMEYEDYKAVTGNILGVSGPLELVELDGVQYVHATGTGKGAIIYENGTTDHIKVNKAKADLILMCGQSNAAYHAADPETALSPEMGTGFYFGTTSGMPEDTTADVTGYKFYDFIGPDGLRVGDKGPAFARTWYGETGHKAIWISLGMSGRQIAFWDDGRAAWNKDLEIMTLANQLMPEGFDIEGCYLFWSQGETDYLGETGYQHYIDTWTSFHDRAPEAWDRDIDHWYLAMGRYETCGWVNDAFLELADNMDDVSIGSTITESFTVDNGMVRTDNLHYTQIGDNALAVSLARACAKDQGATLSKAPVYLQETIVRCDVGDDVTLGDFVQCKNVDGGSVNLPATWDSSPSTATAGVYSIAGTGSSSQVLDGTPEPLAMVYVGYIGFVDGIEYCLNSTGASVIGRSYLAEDGIIPETVQGASVTEIADYGLFRMPWTEVSIPDTVTTLGYRSVYATPNLESLYIGSGLTTLDWNVLSAHLIKDGAELTQAEWRADPSILSGTWLWDGETAGTLYYQETTP